MKAVEAGATDLSVWSGQSGAWSVASTVRLYENIQHLFNYPNANGKIRRSDQISWITVYNLFKRHGSKFAIDAGEGTV